MCGPRGGDGTDGWDMYISIKKHIKDSIGINMAQSGTDAFKEQ